MAALHYTLNERRLLVSERLQKAMDRADTALLTSFQLHARRMVWQEQQSAKPPTVLLRTRAGKLEIKVFERLS